MRSPRRHTRNRQDLYTDQRQNTKRGTPPVRMRATLSARPYGPNIDTVRPWATDNIGSGPETFCGVFRVVLSERTQSLERLCGISQATQRISPGSNDLSFQPDRRIYPAGGEF